MEREGTQLPDYVTLGFERIESDLKMLMEAMAAVLRDLGHPELARCLPWSGFPAPAAGSLSPPRLGLAYAVAFQLLNMVEEAASAAMRDLREQSEGVPAEQGLWGCELRHLKDAGWNDARIARHLPAVRVEPVLTAHPTEAKRLAVLDHHRTLYSLISERRPATPAALHSLREAVKAALERLWRTGEILLEKPALADERRNVMHYLREVFPSVLPVLDERLRFAWQDAGFDPALLENRDSLPKLAFGTWVGGDRDGHPGVTAEVTAETLEQLRLNALLVHHRALSALAGKLTLTTWMQPSPAGLKSAIEDLCAKAGPHGAALAKRMPEEPWRLYAELVIARLPLAMSPESGATLRAEPGCYKRASELKADLLRLHSLLAEAGARRLALTDVDPVIRAVDVFGFHLASLDIRQNSAFHAKALSQLMSAAGLDGGDWEHWSETERLRFLERELRSPRPFLHPSATSAAGPEAAAVVGCHRVLAEHIAAHGADGIGALIVSMTRRLSDLLAVYLLAREAGLLRAYPEGIVCLLPVVPLFETADDLAAGPELLRSFLAQAVTHRSLQFHAKREGRAVTQQVMVGYSDSNKDAGILASQWALQKAQSAIAEIGAEHGVAIRFFHGRGGTVSRGAGPTHRFLDALPHGSLCGDIRLTEQGETIAQKYANPATAAYNLELLLAGVTATSCLHTQERHTPHALSPLLERMAADSRRAYRSLLEAPGFIEFYRQATPIDALEHSRIGSRPSRRTGQPSIDDLRAIPWVFSWNQARFYVPGWFGAGSALAGLSPDELKAVSAEIRAWPFLHYVITNIEASLASADAGIMADYAALVTDAELRGRFMQTILAEFDLTKRMIEALRGRPMHVRRPRMWKTLKLRADALRVLHTQQISQLRRWRELGRSGDEAGASALLPDLLLSINAIASGLRTTG